MPAFAAALLVLGALGAWAAVASGKSDGGLVENTSAGVGALLDAHENWAERTLTAAAIAAVIAVGSVALFRLPARRAGVGRGRGAGGLVAAWTVYETGHRGGALVYPHGAGVNTARTPLRQPAIAQSGENTQSRAGSGLKPWIDGAVGLRLLVIFAKQDGAVKILLAEDDSKLLRHLAAGLREAGHTVDCAQDGAEARWAVENGAHDVLVLDIMMPQLDGVTLVRGLRRRGLTVPILFITARGEVRDRVAGLDAGRG